MHYVIARVADAKIDELDVYIHNNLAEPKHNALQLLPT